MENLLLDVIAVLFAAYAVSLVFTSNFNMGNLIVWILAAALGSYAIWYREVNAWFKTGVGRAAWWALAAGFAFLAAMLVFVAVSGYTNPATGREQVVIVLGAGLRKDRPSMLLRYRLDAAYRYAEEHPDTLLITTGGQGRDETVPEGQAMRKYLIDQGLDAERVIAETKSTSTEENFRFAGEILEERGMNQQAPTVYVTNAFHCYRAGQYAKREGFIDAQALPAGIPLRSIPTCYLREVFAILYYWAFKTSDSGWMHGMVGLLDLNKRFFYR